MAWPLQKRILQEMGAVGLDHDGLAFELLGLGLVAALVGGLRVGGQLQGLLMQFAPGVGVLAGKVIVIGAGQAEEALLGPFVGSLDLGLLRAALFVFAALADFFAAFVEHRLLAPGRGLFEFDVFGFDPAAGFALRFDDFEDLFELGRIGHVELFVVGVEIAEERRHLAVGHGHAVFELYFHVGPGIAEVFVLGSLVVLGGAGGHLALDLTGNRQSSRCPGADLIGF